MSGSASPAAQSACSAAAALAQELVARRLRLVTAESCTGGLIAARCTDLAGSSAWFDRAWVTYSNAAKTQMLGVPEVLIAQYGAVSEPVAQAMAQGAVRAAFHHAPAGKPQYMGLPEPIAVATTGIAGPSGGSLQKPVGTVCFGFCLGAQTFTLTHRFAGDREQVRTQAAVFALARLLRWLQALPAGSGLNQVSA